MSSGQWPREQGSRHAVTDPAQVAYTGLGGCRDRMEHDSTCSGNVWNVQTHFSRMTLAGLWVTEGAPWHGDPGGGVQVAVSGESKALPHGFIPPSCLCVPVGLSPSRLQPDAGVQSDSGYILSLPQTVSLWVSLFVLPARLCLHTMGQDLPSCPDIFPGPPLPSLPACATSPHGFLEGSSSSLQRFPPFSHNYCVH